MSERRSLGASLVGAAAGGVLSVATDRAVAQQPYRVAAYAAGLVAAAAIYPVARLGRPTDSAVAIREWSSVIAAVVVLIGALTLPKRWAAALTASGWIAHATFDKTHDRGTSSRLPGWYPALCAGYDIGVAVLLSPDIRR